MSRCHPRAGFVTVVRSSDPERFWATIVDPAFGEVRHGQSDFPVTAPAALSATASVVIPAAAALSLLTVRA